MKEIIIDFQIPYPDPAMERMTFFKQSCVAGPHFDLWKRLSTALESMRVGVSLNVFGMRCDEPVPSQRSDFRVECDEEKVDAVKKIILETIAEDDHGLLEVSLEVCDEDDVYEYEVKGEKQ